MRRKFKVWDSKLGQWFEPCDDIAYDGHLLDVFVSRNGDLVLVKHPFAGAMEFLPESKYPNRFIIIWSTEQVGGYFGREGKEIYEGDVLRCHNFDSDEEYTGVVKRQDGSFIVDCGSVCHDLYKYHVMNNLGNILEKPELVGQLQVTL